jgi:hypothetical protein
VILHLTGNRILQVLPRQTNLSFDGVVFGYQTFWGTVRILPT